MAAQNLDDVHVRRALQEMGRKGVHRQPVAFCANLSNYLPGLAN